MVAGGNLDKPETAARVAWSGAWIDLGTGRPVSVFGEAWPAGVPVQIHGMAADPYFIGAGDVDAARDLVESTPNAALFLYPGEQHLFADSSLRSYDADAAVLLTERVLEFLSGIG